MILKYRVQYEDDYITDLLDVTGMHIYICPVLNKEKDGIHDFDIDHCNIVATNTTSEYGYVIVRFKTVKQANYFMDLLFDEMRKTYFINVEALIDQMPDMEDDDDESP